MIQLMFIILILQVSLITSTNHELDPLINEKQMEIISGSMAHPCNDFHQYACGNWKQVFPEAGTKYNNTIELLDYNVNKEMSDIFNKYTLVGKPTFIQEAYKYYKSCVNLQDYEPNKYWKYLMRNENKETKWFKTLATMRKYGLNNIFIAQGDMIWVNKSRNVIITLNKVKFKPLTFYEFNELINKNNDNLQIWQEIKNFMKSLGESTEDHEEFDYLQSLWKEIEKFEKDIQQLDDIPDKEEEYDLEEYYESKHFVQFKNLHFEWLKEYVKIIVNQKDPEPEMLLYIQNVPYMRALEEFFEKYQKPFVKFYMALRFLVYLHSQEPKEFNEINCLSSTRRFMPFAMHWLYEQQHPELLKEYENIYQIYDNVRNHFNKTIKANKYEFNQTEIEFLQNKINNMQLRFNNIPRTDTIAALKKYYGNLHLNADNFYENHLKLQHLAFQLPIDLAFNNQVAIDDTFYIRNEHISKPYYLRDANVLVLPLTLLQPPIYGTGLDDVFKYSTLGFIIAKEFFQGFDMSGLYYNADGSRTSINLEDFPLFVKTLNYQLNAMPGCLNKKILYPSALRYSYETFFAVNADNIKPEEKMSLSKQFFLNFAQTFCDTSGNLLIMKFINQALKLFPKFSQTFNCSKNHVLYSQQDYNLW